jgi:hypothetical protein
MRTVTSLIVTCVFLAVLALTTLRAPAQQGQGQGQGQGDAPKDVQVSDVAVRTLGAQNYLYVAAETTFDQISETVGPIVGRLQKLRADKKAVFTGPLVFVYHDVEMDPGRKFKLEVGYPVAEGTQAPAQGEFKVRKLEPLKCATVLYGGPLSSVHSAYEKLMPAASAQGRKPTGELRDYYLYWEGEQSVNNVEMIAIGVE